MEYCVRKWNGRCCAGYRSKIDHDEFCPGADDPDASDSDAAVDTSTAYLNECKSCFSEDMIEGAGSSSEALSGAYPINGEDYDIRDYYPDDDIDGHGTHVSGIVGAPVNDTGITGAAFGASIMPIKVLFLSNNNRVEKCTMTSDIALELIMRFQKMLMLLII